MTYFKTLLTIAILFFGACKEQSRPSKLLNTFLDSTNPFKKEIPTYENGTVEIFYSLAKAKQKQLGLDSTENGFDALQIRIWYDFALVRERKLVVITYSGVDWTATVYNLEVKWDGETETILSKTVKSVIPKSGWADFSTKLLNLKIITLPNQDNIFGYSAGHDGRTYNVEVATKYQYRFYGYWEPQEYQDKFWQAKNMTDILNLFAIELGV